MKLESLGKTLFNLIKVILPWLFVVLVIALVTWQYPSYKKGTHSVQKSDRETVLIPGLSAQKTAYLIKLTEPSVANSLDWAKDLMAALDTHHLARSRENVCAMIAVISQESSFTENPSAPALSNETLRALATKLAQIPQFTHKRSSFENWMKHKPHAKNSYWMRLNSLQTERELDRTYRKMITDSMVASNQEDSLLKDAGALRDSIEDINEINAIGSMQVAVSFAVQIEEQLLKRPMTLDEIWAVRDRMYTRKGGMYYGALLLLGYDVGYDKKLYRFADFNAGRFASRNAAFQATIGELLGKTLATDGDLLIYDPQGKPAVTISNSEQAINETVQKYGLSLTEENIRHDLLQEKQIGFNHTHTYQAITQQYKELTGQQAPIAMVPNIVVLHPEKHHRPMTTEKFATTVNNRYQQCMGK